LSPPSPPPHYSWRSPIPTPAPAELAERAAVAVNKLNHATILGARPGLVHPGDAYSTVASLKELAGCLPRTFEQVGAFLHHLDQQGSLRLDDGNDPACAVADLDDALRRATAAAHQLRNALDQAHSALGPVGYEAPRATAARRHTSAQPARPTALPAVADNPAQAPSTARRRR
jgi:hypothetical protein